VKEFGKKMVDDHGKANDELKSIAQKKNITLPSDLSMKDKALRDRLAKLSGPAFDRAYMQAMLKDHREDVNEFRTESQSGADPDIKQFAAKTLPTLESHLKLAQDDSKAVGTSGTMTKKTKKPSGR
jgi:putative membrane protein